MTINKHESDQEYQRGNRVSEGANPEGGVHTIDEMKAWLKPLGYSDAINDAAINFILREFVMSKISSENMMNMDMVVELLRPQLDVTTEDIEPIIIMG